MLEFQARINKIMKILNHLHGNHEKKENHIISRENHENYEDLRIPFENYENNVNLIVSFENYENHENHRIPRTGIWKIMKILEVHVIIMKIKQKSKNFMRESCKS